MYLEKNMNYLEMFDEWHDLTNSKQTIDNFCEEKKINLTREEKIKLLSEISKKDVFRYSTFLSNSIPLIVKNNDAFLELLQTIIQATKGDLVTGCFEMALIKIGRENSELAIELSEKMQKIEDIRDLSAAPLGGIGCENYSKIEKIVNCMLASENPEEVTLGIRTIRIAFNHKNMDNKEKIFSKIQTALEHNNEKINIEATIFFLKFYEQKPNISQKNLLSLAKINDIHKRMIIKHLWINPIKNEDNAITLIEECLNIQSTNIQYCAYSVLKKYTKTKHKKIMNIIHKSLESKEQPYVVFGDLIKELGKNALHESLNSFEEWFATDDIPLQCSMLQFPRYLIPNGREQCCFQYFEKWSNSELIPTDSFLNIYTYVLARCYQNECDQDFIKNSKKLLLKMVSDSGLKPKFFLRNIEDETLQCASLITGLKYYSDNLDYEMIYHNIKLFPKLKILFDMGWISKMKKENNRTNLLLRVLERKLPEDDKINEILNTIEESKNNEQYNWNRDPLGNYVYNFLYLRNIDQNIISLQKKGIDIIKHFKSKLHNDEQVDDTISELNLLGHLAEHYDLELEVPIEAKNIDSLIIIDGQKFYLEIINTKQYLPLDLFKGEVFKVDNRIKNKILDKCEKQFSKIPENDISVVLGIDIRKSDIDVMSVTDALYGRTVYTFQMGKETYDDRGVYSSLENNSIHKSKPESDMLSAVLCFKSELPNGYKFHITGELIHNPNAKNPLTLNIIKKIEEVLIQKENDNHQ